MQASQRFDPLRFLITDAQLNNSVEGKKAESLYILTGTQHTTARATAASCSTCWKQMVQSKFVFAKINIVQLRGLSDRLLQLSQVIIKVFLIKDTKYLLGKYSRDKPLHVLLNVLGTSSEYIFQVRNIINYLIFPVVWHI